LPGEEIGRGKRGRGAAPGKDVVAVIFATFVGDRRYVAQIFAGLTAARTSGWGGSGAAAISGCYRNASFAADTLQMQQR
jgi:hypothetical protein